MSSHPTNLATPLSLTLTNGDWDVIRGLLNLQWAANKPVVNCGECAAVNSILRESGKAPDWECSRCRNKNAHEYAATCERIMREIDSAKGRK